MNNSDHIDAAMKQLKTEIAILQSEVEELNSQVKAEQEHRQDVERQLNDALDAKKWFMGFYDQLHRNACELKHQRDEIAAKYSALQQSILKLTEEDAKTTSVMRQPKRAKPPVFEIGDDE